MGATDDQAITKRLRTFSSRIEHSADGGPVMDIGRMV